MEDKLEADFPLEYLRNEIDNFGYSQLKQFIEQQIDLAVSKERERIVEVIKGATRKKKPTHGTCCTCQDCGYCNDYECECPRNNTIEEILSLINTK